MNLQHYLARCAVEEWNHEEKIEEGEHGRGVRGRGG
jgi:hypothetical protein